MTFKVRLTDGWDLAWPESRAGGVQPESTGEIESLGVEGV